MPSGEKKNKKKIDKIEPRSALRVAEASQKETKKTKTGGSWFVTLLFILMCAGLIYTIVDKLTAWGNTPVLLQRTIDAAENNTIYKKYDKAERQYVGLIEKWNGKEKYNAYVKQARLNLALVYKDSGKNMEAASIYRELVKENVENKDMHAWLLLELGECLNNVMDMDGALNAYSIIIKDYSGTDWAAEAMFGSAEAYRNKKAFGKALKYYNMIVDKYKKGFLSAEAMTSIGKMYEEQGNLEMAYETYTKILKAYPEIVTDFAKTRLEILELKIKK